MSSGFRDIAKADSSEIKRLYDDKIKTMQKTQDENALFKIGVHGSLFKDNGVGMDLMYLFVEIFDVKSGVTYKESHPIYGDKSILFDFNENDAIFNQEKAINYLKTLGN